jgi:hypothetical protein
MVQEVTAIMGQIQLLGQYSPLKVVEVVEVMAIMELLEEMVVELDMQVILAVQQHKQHKMEQLPMVMRAETQVLIQIQEVVEEQVQLEVREVQEELEYQIP